MKAIAFVSSVWTCLPLRGGVSHLLLLEKPNDLKCKTNEFPAIFQSGHLNCQSPCWMYSRPGNLEVLNIPQSQAFELLAAGMPLRSLPLCGT
jgi:hypothetical protein